MSLPKLCLLLLCLLLSILLFAPAIAAQDSLARFEDDRCPASVPRGENARCGWLIVPEDRANPDPTDTLRLQVVVFPAWGDNPAPDPIVYLEGGPGGNPTETLNLVYNLRYKPYAENRDLIFIDQRGTGRSEPALDCPEYDQALIDLLPQDVSVEAESAQILEAFAACRTRLTDQGANLSAYTSAANAADIAELRIALGYGEWNLWGISYGTRLALTVMRDYPEGVRSVILDSVLPPQVNLFSTSPDNFQRALDVFFAGCAADAGCSAAYPDLEATFYAAVDALNAEPVMLTITNPLTMAQYEARYDGTGFMALIFQLLYDTGTIPQLPALITNVSEGKYGTVAQYEGALLLNAQFISVGMYYSVQCAEELSFETLESLEAGYTAALEDAPEQFQAYYAGTAEALIDLCATWDAAPAGANENDPVVSDIPTLVMNGEYDPATPPAWGELAAETLPNSTVFTYPGVGHGSSVSGDACPQQMALAFLANPANVPDATCISSMGGPVFVTPQTTLSLASTTIDTFAGAVDVLLPEGWTEIAPGAYAESLSSTNAILYQGIPGGNVDALLPTLIGQFGADASAVEPVGTRAANGLTWVLYEVAAAGFQMYIATAQSDGVGYVIIVLTNPDNAEFYYESLFLPAVDGFMP